MLTEDKDFGWLVFASHVESAGVILIRYPGHLHQTLADDVLRLVQQQGEKLAEAFVVLQPGRIRINHKAAK